MKNVGMGIGYTFAAIGLIGTAGIIGYCMLNKDTKQQAEKLLNKVVNDTSKQINKMM